MKTFLAVCLLLVFASGVVNAAGKQKLSDQDKERALAEALIEASKETSAKLPLMLDDETRLDSTKSIGKQVYNKHTMIKADARKMDKIFFKKEMHSMLAKGQCSNENMVNLLKMGVVHNYTYQDKNGNLIATIKISKKDCGL